MLSSPEMVGLQESIVSWREPTQDLEIRFTSHHRMCVGDMILNAVHLVGDYLSFSINLETGWELTDHSAASP